MADTAGISRGRANRNSILGGLGRPFRVRGTTAAEAFRINATALGRVLLGGLGTRGWHRRGVCPYGVYDRVAPASGRAIHPVGNGRGHLQPSWLAAGIDDNCGDAGSGGSIAQRVEGCAGWRSRERRRDELDLVAQCSFAVTALIFIMALCFWLLVDKQRYVNSMQAPIEAQSEVGETETSYVLRPAQRMVAGVDR